MKEFLILVCCFFIGVLMMHTIVSCSSSTAQISQPDPCDCLEQLRLAVKDHPDKNSTYVLLPRADVEECLGSNQEEKWKNY